MAAIEQERRGIVIRIRILFFDTTPPTQPTPLILSQSYNAIHRLYYERAKRITALQSTFPPRHYIIVAALATSICIAFLWKPIKTFLSF
jgi:hypothetical protein